MFHVVRLACLTWWESQLNSSDICLRISRERILKEIVCKTNRHQNHCAKKGFLIRTHVNSNSALTCYLKWCLFAYCPNEHVETSKWLRWLKISLKINFWKLSWMSNYISSKNICVCCSTDSILYCNIGSH